MPQAVYGSAEREYKDSLKDNLLGTTQSNKWWSTLKAALFDVNMTIPALLKPDGSLTHDPKEKATLFADVFDRKQSNDKLTMPQTSFPEAKLTSLAFRSCEIKGAVTLSRFCRTTLKNLLSHGGCREIALDRPLGRLTHPANNSPTKAAAESRGGSQNEFSMFNFWMRGLRQVAVTDFDGYR